MCEHDITKKDHSVLMNKRCCMVAPSTIYGVCSQCGKFLIYIKNQDGIYVLKEGEEANENFGSHA